MPRSLRGRRICWFLVSLVFFPGLQTAAPQLGGVFGAGRAKKRPATPIYPMTMETPKPELLTPDTNPTLQYPVAVNENNSISCGWFDITRTGVSYKVIKSGKAGKSNAEEKYAAPPGAKFLAAPSKAANSEEFEAAFSEIKDTKFEKTFLLLYTAQMKIVLIYLPQYQWGAMDKTRQFDDASQQTVAGTLAVQRAMQNFDTVLAEVRPPALAVSLRADPATVERGRPVTLVWNSSNAASLDLEPGVGLVAAAGSMTVIPQDSTNYTLSALGPAGTKVSSAYVTVSAQGPATVPTIVLTDPAATEGQTVEVAASPLIIHGVVMDASGIPVVSVNGRSVTMRTTTAQAAQFTSDPIDLQPGANRFEVSAVNNARGQAKVTFVARLTPSAPKTASPEPGNPRGLDKLDIISLLQGDVASARVAELVRQRGIKFAPTADDLRDIRAAGGGDDLINAISLASGPSRN